MEKEFSKIFLTFKFGVDLDNIYDDEQQGVPSHEKAYFDSGPQLSDSQIVDLLNDHDDFNDDGVSTILVVYGGH